MRGYNAIQTSVIVCISHPLPPVAPVTLFIWCHLPAVCYDHMEWFYLIGILKARKISKTNLLGWWTRYIFKSNVCPVAGVDRPRTEMKHFAGTASTYHGYAMRKILPLCIKTVTGKSKGFPCLFGHNSRIHCFCLKNLNLFSQNITFRVINYLNLVEKINRNWNVDEVSVPIISKDIR